MISLISYESSGAHGFVASEGYARNRDSGETTVGQWLGVEVLFETAGPLSAGQFDLERNRFFMQDMVDHLMGFSYPPPNTPNTPNFTFTRWNVTAQSDASGNMINITYTNAFTAGGLGLFMVGSRSLAQPFVFHFGQCGFRLRTALNSNPPRYNRIWCSKVKYTLINKKFPVCISNNINGVIACENSSVGAAGGVEGQWLHNGSEIEIFPALPNLGSISSDWIGARRADLYPNLGQSGMEGFAAYPTPACCQIS